MKNLCSQEVSIVFVSDLFREVLGCKLVFVVFGFFGGQVIGDFFQELESIGFVNFFVFSGFDVVFDLLLELVVGDFGGGGVFFVGNIVVSKMVY